MEDRERPGGHKIEIERDDPPSQPGEVAADEVGDDRAAAGEADQDAPEEQTADAEVGPEELQAEVQRLTELYEQEHDSHLRAVAELQNFRRRTAREQAERLQFANQQLLCQLLPIADNLERAVAHGDEDASGEDFARGVELVLSELRRVLEIFGVERIDAEQETFDPAVHEAVAQVETDEAAEGTILHVDSPGYRLHDRCIRPAKVIVARRPSEQS